MKSRSKILATVVAAAIAASTISVPAFADNKKPTTAALFPALAGPVGVAAGISATKDVPYLIVKDFYFKIWDKYGWQQLKHLQKLGFRISKDIYHHKIVKVHAVKRVHTARTN